MWFFGGCELANGKGLETRPATIPPWPDATVRWPGYVQGGRASPGWYPTMAPEHLPEDLKLAGQRLLEATDTLGLEAQGAAWIYEPDLEEWRYYLVTVLLDWEGPT